MYGLLSFMLEPQGLIGNVRHFDNVSTHFYKCVLLITTSESPQERETTNFHVLISGWNRRSSTYIF